MPEETCEQYLERALAERDRLKAVNEELVAVLDRLAFAFGQKDKRGDDYLILAEARAVIAKARP